MAKFHPLWKTKDQHRLNGGFSRRHFRFLILTQFHDDRAILTEGRGKVPLLPAKNALTEFDLRDILNMHGDHCHGAIQLTEVEFTT